MRRESQDALDKLGGALMDVDDSTPDEVSSLMAKVKFLGDRIVLKVRTLDVSEDHPLSVVLGQLTTAEKQYAKRPKITRRRDK